MNEVRLPGSARKTSQLAIGTSRLMGATSMRASLALLEAAFEAGIRHVDTAPSYGVGEAERCLGEFLKRHRGAVTVTTKYGISAPKNPGLLRVARMLVRPVIARSGAIKRKLQHAMAQTHTSSRPTLNVADAREALENSLRVLGMEHIDIWLLHEARAEDLDDDLLGFLEESVRAGKVGAFGVGSESSKVAAVYEKRREFCPVVQCEWNPLAGNDPYPGTFRVHHSVVREWEPLLSSRMKAEPELAARWSAQVGVDLMAPGRVAGLLLRVATLANPAGVTLFSSKKAENVAMNVQIAEDAGMETPAMRLRELILQNSSMIQPLA